MDLGTRTTGLATTEGSLATPYKTIFHNSLKESVEKISQEAIMLNAEKVILGYVPGKIQTLFEKFKEEFQKKNPNIEVVMVDETLTSRQATDEMIKLQMSKRKRAAKEHETAAAILLQNYLDDK